MWWFDRDGAPTRARDTLITAASADAARLYKLERAGVPAGMRPLAANASWTAHAGAC